MISHAIFIKNYAKFYLATTDQASLTADTPHDAYSIYNDSMMFNYTISSVTNNTELNNAGT